MSVLTPDLADVIEQAQVQARELDRLRMAQFVLVRIDDVGERWRCRECGCRHKHFTLMCVERPFRGLTEGLRAYWQNTDVPDRDLSPLQRARRQEIARSLNLSTFAPALSTRHPRAAAALATPETDLDLGAWVLGTIDPISETKARTLAALINARARQPVIRL